MTTIQKNILNRHSFINKSLSSLFFCRILWTNSLSDFVSSWRIIQVKKSGTSLLGRLCFPILLLSNVLATDINVDEYFTNDPNIIAILDRRKDGAGRENAAEALRSIKSILDEQPNLLRAHIVRGHILLRSEGNIEDALAEYYWVKTVCGNIKSSGADYSRYSKKIDKMLNNIDVFSISRVDQNFGSLRFKIRNKNIPKFCHLRNVDVVFTFEKEVKENANDLQKKRLDFLYERLISGQMKFQFSAYDSVDGKYYFEIPYFPLIEVQGAVEELYAIILNNENRYHFNINHQHNEAIEIDWNDQWELLESVPDGKIKIEYTEPFSLKAYAGDTYMPVTATITTSETEAGVKNLYIPAKRNDEIILRLEQNKKLTIVEKILFYSSRSVIAVAILYSLYLVRG